MARARMSKLFWLVKLLSGRKSMKSILIVSGIGLIVLLALFVWAAVAGVGLVSGRLPHWLAGGERLAAEAVRRVQETLPMVTDRVAESVPGLARRIEGLVPGAAFPTQDVGGEDLADIPRFPGMVRVAYSLTDQKRTVAYQARADFAQVVAFYTREMAQRGFVGQVTAASAAEENHLYRRGNEQFAFRFTKVSRLGAEITALEISDEPGTGTAGSLL